MNNITAVNAEDFDCTVECGVTRGGLNSYIRDTGLWFPIGNHRVKLLHLLISSLRHSHPKPCLYDWSLTFKICKSRLSFVFGHENCHHIRMSDTF